MRKLIPMLACILLGSICDAQYVNIPDNNFRGFLQANYPGCMNGSGQLDTTCSVLLAVDSLGFGGELGIYCNYYHDMEGIQYFKNLKKFFLYNTCLEHCPLPPSVEYISTSYSSGFTIPPNLKYLDISYGGLPDNTILPASLEIFIAKNAGLTSLAALPASLKLLDISNPDFSGSPNTIRQLPTLPSGLKFLNCAYNYITTLPQLPPSLTYFNCSGNIDYVNNAYLTSLPALPPSLDTFDCVNPLSQMPDLPTGITYLRFSGGTMTGLPAFPPGLKTLMIENAPQLASLPALPASITYLLCHETKVAPIATLPAALKTLIFDHDSMLTSLPAIPAGVDYINCSFNRLASFPALPAVLKYFDCGGNRLASLPALPSGLTYLNAAENRLTTLPALPAVLNWLFVNNNQLASLPAISQTSVYYLSCSYNNLTTLPALPAVLNGMYCDHNQLTSLPALPVELDTLGCDNNNIIALPALNAQLSILMCHNNQLSELPELTGSSLYGISCYGNNIYCLPRLPQTTCPLQIIVDTAKVRCIPNTIPNGIIKDYRQGIGLDACGTGLYYWVELPLCNPTNNIGNCHAYPVISGNAFYDINSNGIKDANELYKQNLSVRLQNNETTFTNSNGYFEIAAVGTGNNTITLGTVRFYNVVPSSSLYNFTSYDTTVTKDYALRPAVTKDSLSITVVPLYWAARPGFAYYYRVLYENIGTTIINHTLQFAYDSSKLVYDSASSPLAVNTGNSITMATSNFVPGQRGMLDVYFRVKTTAPLTSQMLAKATITSGSNVWADSSYTEINGAYDPNDKHATPQLSPSQVAAGSFINYSIRFQNTGTDTAFTVVVTDTLSSLLQYNTLQMIATSHTCKTTVKGNIVYFEFRNILLPDSNVNEFKSHGFVSFKIKPQTTVGVNTVIPNNAAIYFDYNTPVITNTAGTLIKDFIIVPLRLISFSAVPQTDRTTTLYWNTANEINTQHFVIERGDDGLRFNSLTNIVAKGKANNNYTTTVADANTGIIFYRLKIVDNDGSFSYSPILKIDRRKNAAGFSVLSNPVKDVIILNTNNRALNNTSCNIINTQGAVVRTFIIRQGSQTISIKGLPAGLYYLQTNSCSEKIFIQ